MRRQITDKPIPDTRRACGINGCTDLTDPWKLGCTRHLEMLPPGLMRMIIADAASQIASDTRRRAVAQAWKIWNGAQMDQDFAPPMAIQHNFAPNTERRATS